MVLNGGEVRVSGYYTFFLNGKPVFEAPSKNLITDFGWTRLSNLGSSAETTLVCQLGTSNTPPALTDTALGSLLASKTGATAQAGSGTDANGNFSSTTYTFSFAQGAVIGNVAEVGFKILAADSGLTSRSLVKDGLGNPAIIVVTAIDQLTVVYELRYSRAALDVTSTVLVAGVSTTYVLRTAAIVPGTVNANASIGGLSVGGFNTFFVGGTGSTLGAPDVAASLSNQLNLGGIGATGVSITVNPTNTVVNFTTPVFGTGTGNASGGIFAITFTPSASSGGLKSGAYGDMKASFSPPIPKDGTKTLSISFSYTFTRL